MRRLIISALSVAILASRASAVLAQADAQATYQQAKAVYQAGKYTEARDLARNASQTDPKNPEILLLLGKASYQLGELDEAIGAWKQTLTLAPEEPFAAKMLEVLQGRRADVDTRIRLVEAMVAERLFMPAAEECRSLLSNKAPSDAQRARVMTLQADLAVRTGQPQDAQKILRELLVLYPKHADPVQTMLLAGQAKLRTGGGATAEGLALLKDLIKDHAETTAAASAQLELITFDLEQGMDAARAAALARWLADNPKHPLAADASRRLVGAYLAVTRQGPKPAIDGALSTSDMEAFTVADELMKQSVRAAETQALTEQLVKHLDAHYAGNQGFSAAIQGAERLLAGPLPHAARLPVLRAIGQYKGRLAINRLDVQAKAGQLAAADESGKLPKELAEAVAVYETINKEYPAEPAWAEVVALASRVRTCGVNVVWPEEAGLRGSDAWAITIALAAIRANPEVIAATTTTTGTIAGVNVVKSGVELLQGMVRDYAKPGYASVQQRSLLASRLLVGLPLLPEQPAGPGVMVRQTLVEAYLAVSRQAKRPPDVGLSESDRQALTLVVELCKQSVRPEEVKLLADQVIPHLETFYASNPAGAIEGAKMLLAVKLSPADRRLVLRTLGRATVEIVMKFLEGMAKAGLLAADDEPGKLPKALAEAVAVYETINKEYPAEPAWAELVALASRVRACGANVAWPDQVAALRGPDAWAIDIALPVVKANVDAAVVKTAVELFQGIINDYVKLDQPGARALPVAISRQLIAAPLSPNHLAWPGVMASHAGYLDGYAKFLFSENFKAGRGEENTKLSNVQKELLDTLAKLVANDAGQAPAAMNRVAEHVKPWIEHSHWAVAEEAYAALAAALPESFRRDGELTVVKLWVAQVLRRDGRLASAGLTVPRKIDPLFIKALERCYALQGGLDLDSAKLRQVRGTSDSIIAHYRNLEYNDVAEAAIRVKPKKAVDAADQYAAYQLVQLHEGQARREVARLLEQYGAAEKIALTPALKAVIAAWCGFITERPASPLAPATAEQMLGIARQYEQYGAFDVAAGIYADFAKFAAGVKILAQGEPSMAERALHSSAIALDAHARKLLAKAAADRKSNDPPPAKLSGEFVAAIDAYKTFAETYPDSRLLAETIRRVIAVGLEYSQIDSWDVADGVYADLQKSKLKLRRPERLEFARGLCQLGRAMPIHAREMLQVLGSAGLGESRDSGERSGGEGSISVATATPPAGSGLSYQTPADAPPPMPTGRPASPAAAAEPPVRAGSIAADRPDAVLPPSPESQRDTQLLAMIQRQEGSRSARVAQLGGNATLNQTKQPLAQDDEQGQQSAQQVRQGPAAPVLSDAELARQEKALDAAYAIFQGIGKNYPDSPTVRQVRGEILVMIGHWRSLTQWQRSAALAMRFLGDNPADPDLAKLRLEVARGRLAWASQPIGKKMTKQEMLAEVASRFAAARADLAAIVADFPKERGCQQEAQWDVANSFLAEARVIGAVSPTLTRGQFVRAARELRAVAAKYPNHPRLGEIPQLLWNVAQELENGGYEDESVVVWNELGTYDPLHPLAQQGAMKVAQTYQRGLKRPLKAAEAYMELNFIRGGNDPAMQAAIFQIGTSLKTEKRWVEAMQVLETFVNTFPRHPQAGQALTMVGQIHQTNEAWKDAIAAYRRVVAEYKDGQWVQEAKWAIAECTINLSQWQEAAAAYRDYAAAYPSDSKLAEANRRIEVLKDLARYQGLIDEKGQRKAFDAQFQIATIVRNQLANPVKGIIEYRKVVANWPESYVAASALYEIGTSYLSLGETAKARESLQAVAKGYATSPLAGAAMFMVGKSYEDEADKLATVTREKSLEYNKDIAQREAYQSVQNLRNDNSYAGQSRIESLKKSGKGGKEVEYQEAANSVTLNNGAFVFTQNFAQKAQQDVETLTSTQLADRQDKINAALRKAIDAYATASKIPGGAKADAALLQMATIYDQRLKDSKAAVETWLEIVRQFSGTTVAEDASWKLAQYYERERKYAQAIEAYNAFLRNYRRSPNAGAAQFAVAECYEHLGQWVAAMDSYNNYINNFADGPLVAKAKEQINWIKTYRL